MRVSRRLLHSGKQDSGTTASRRHFGVISRMLPSVRVPLSGERLQVTYRLAGDEREARAKAENICLEQTVELPRDLVPAGDILNHIVGSIESLEAVNSNHHLVVISYAVETTGFELAQLLNVVLGNSSLQPGIRVERLDLPDRLLKSFNGPRFGIQGLRERLKVSERPILCTALKPMGLAPDELADLAYQFALGGIDMIKDDHGLADQAFSPFRERVPRCAEAVARANRETGYNCIYLPNVTGPADRVVENALFAKEAGAGGLLMSPGLIGFDFMRLLADDDRIALPILNHPSFQGSFVVSPDQGISPYALFGQIARLAGTDGMIYPNFGGRFSLTREECLSINAGCVVPMGRIKPSIPVPAGGMSLDRVPGMLSLYGRDVVLLIGGGLMKKGRDIVENCREFRRLVQESEDKDQV